MDHPQLGWIANFIWSIADDVLRDLYVRGKYRDVILPMTVLRRLDSLLEPSKPAVLEMKRSLDEAEIVHQDQALRQAAGQAFYNTSNFTLRDLKARASQQQLKADFEAYLDGFSPNVQDILEKFEFRNQIPRLSKADALGTLIEKFLSPDVNLSPHPVLHGDGNSINARKGNTWADYPGLGMNEQWVAINTNNFSFRKASFKESLFFVTDTATIVDNATNCPNITTFRLRAKKKDNSGRRVFTPQVAQHHTATNIAGTPLFAVNSQYGGGTGYALWRITKGEGAKPRLNHDVITASGYGLPPNAMQKGSEIPLDTLGDRMMAQIVYRDGQLWLAHTSSCTIGTGTELLSCIRVVQMFPAANGATVGFEDLFGFVDHYVWVPGIAVTASGDVIAAFQYAGKKKHLSIAYNGLKQGAARFGPARRPELFDRKKVLASGKCTVDEGSEGGEYGERTGDYVGVISDPSSSKNVWISGEFSGKSAGSCDWFTKIARVSY